MVILTLKICSNVEVKSLAFLSAATGSTRGPDAAAEDGTAVDTTAEDGTAEDATAELFNLRWTLRRSHQILTLPLNLKLRRVGAGLGY